MGFIKSLIEIWLVDRSVSSAKNLFVRLLMLVVAIAVTITVATGLALLLIGGLLVLSYDALLNQGVPPESALLVITSVVLALLVAVVCLAKHHIDRAKNIDWFPKSSIRENIGVPYASLIQSFLNGLQARG